MEGETINKAIIVGDTSGIGKKLAKGDGLFWVMPVNIAAKQVYDGIKRKKRIVYVTRRWKLIAVLMRLIPSAIYKHL